MNHGIRQANLHAVQCGVHPSAAKFAKRALRVIVYARKSSAGYKALDKGLQRRELAVIDTTVEAYEEEMATKGKIELLISRFLAWANIAFRRGRLQFRECTSLCAS
jgi:hypothetical protein